MTRSNLPDVTEPAAPPGDGGLVRVRLQIAYDGSAFAGWARQRDARTVQEEIERALGVVLRLDPPPRLTVAGRTDTGVHATGQVAHVDLPAGTDLRRLAGGVNALLAHDVRVGAADVAPAGFDARFSALARVYRYRVSDAPHGVDPLRRADTVWHRRPLDVAAMNDASGRLVGLRDYAAFCRRRDGATTVRHLVQFSWERDADVCTATVEADAFCHSMVRSLVGAVLAVGDGRRPVDWPASLLDLRARTHTVTVAPPHGLTLVEVRYPPDDELAARAAATRALRDPV